jgi:hypothetical protein
MSAASSVLRWRVESSKGRIRLSLSGCEWNPPNSRILEAPHPSVPRSPALSNVLMLYTPLSAQEHGLIRDPAFLARLQATNDTRVPCPTIAAFDAHGEASPHTEWPRRFKGLYTGGDLCASTVSGIACFHQILTAMVVYDTVCVKVGLRLSYGLLVCNRRRRGWASSGTHSYQARSTAGLSSILWYSAFESIACRHRFLS